MKIINIFLASSKELSPEREKLSDMIEELNETYHDRNLFFHLVKWEHMTSGYNTDYQRKQDEYNVRLHECDLCVSLFWKSLGEYTVEETDLAYRMVNTKGRKPERAFIFFKKEADSEVTSELKKFKEDVPRRYNEHFYWEFTNIDSLKYRILLEILKYLPKEADGSSALRIDDSELKISGKVYANMNNLPFSANCQAYTDVNNNIKYFETLLGNLPQNSDIYTQTLCQLDQYRNQRNQIEKSFLSVTLLISSATSKDNNARFDKASRLLMEGDINGAKEILNMGEIQSDAQKSLALIQAGKQARESLLVNIKELELRAELFIPEGTEDNIREVKSIYHSIIDICEQLGEEELLCEKCRHYGYYLIAALKHRDAIDFALQTIDKMQLQVSKAKMLMLLSSVYRLQMDMGNAVSCITQAIDLCPETLDSSYLLAQLYSDYATLSINKEESVPLFEKSLKLFEQANMQDDYSYYKTRLGYINHQHQIFTPNTKDAEKDLRLLLNDVKKHIGEDNAWNLLYLEVCSYLLSICGDESNEESTFLNVFNTVKVGQHRAEIFIICINYYIHLLDASLKEANIELNNEIQDWESKVISSIRHSKLISNILFFENCTLYYYFKSCYCHSIFSKENSLEYDYFTILENQKSVSPLVENLYSTLLISYFQSRIPKSEFSIYSEKFLRVFKKIVSDDEYQLLYFLKRAAGALHDYYDLGLTLSLQDEIKNFQKRFVEMSSHRSENSKTILADFLNAYAYGVCIPGESFDVGLLLVTHAYNISPDENYLDSMAELFYRKGDTESARGFVREVLDKAPTYYEEGNNDYVKLRFYSDAPDSNNTSNSTPAGKS